MQTLRKAGLVPEYVAIRDDVTLQPPSGNGGGRVVLAAARLGKARLIDNVRV